MLKCMALLVVKEHVIFEVTPLLHLDYRLYIQSVSDISALPLMKKEGKSPFKDS